MAGAVSGQRLGESPQHQVTIGLQHHVNEVDHHDAADIAQTKLTHNFFGRLEVVLGDGLFEIATRAGELPGVDVNYRHRLGAVDHQCAAGGQPDLPVDRLGKLLLYPVHREHIGPVRPARGFILRYLRYQFGRNGIHIFGDRLPGAVTRDDQSGEVLVEQIADDLDQHIRLFVERHGRTGGLRFDLLGLFGNADPAILQSGDITADVFFLDALRRGADYHAGIRGHHLAQDLLETLTFGVWEFAADAGGRCAWHVHQVAACQ